MTKAVKAVYEGGVFRPQEPVQLEEKTEVEVLIPTDAKRDDDPTGWKTARELIGCITEAPLAPNISEDHDRYIYRK
jgi:predicted DNA-binding antitoxin AbrB/MazE fold protein